MPMLKANSTITFRSERRCWCSQRHYLHCLHSDNKIKRKKNTFWH